jgi:hypothetical protein
MPVHVHYERTILFCDQEHKNPQPPIFRKETDFQVFTYDFNHTRTCCRNRGSIAETQDFWCRGSESIASIRIELKNYPLRRSPPIAKFSSSLLFVIDWLTCLFIALQLLAVRRSPFGIGPHSNDS